MAIDPVRLARIRARVLAAATIALPACGGEQTTINQAQPERHVNEPEPDATPVNTAPPDEKPVQDKPSDDHVNRPEPPHVNTPAPDHK